MAYRLSTLQCLAKKAVKASTPVLQRTNSSNIPSEEANFSSESENSNSIHPSINKLMTETRESPSIDSNRKKILEASRNNFDYVDVHSYFKKFYEEDDRRCRHLQPNNLQPYGSTKGLYTPCVLGRKTLFTIKKPEKFSEKQSRDFSTKSLSATEMRKSLFIPGKNESLSSKSSSISESIRQFNTATFMNSHNLQTEVSKVRSTKSKVSIKKNFETKKQLPKFVPKSCSKMDDQNQKIDPCLKMPFKRLKKYEVIEPKRCPKIENKEDPCKRADDNLKIPKKKLVKLLDKDCKTLRTPQMKEGNSLKRLPPPLEINQPVVKICEKTSTDVCPKRSDDGLKVEKKRLPFFSPLGCIPKFFAKLPKTFTPIRRLDKVEMSEPKKSKKNLIEAPKIERADDIMELIKTKSLPEFVPTSQVPFKPRRLYDNPEPYRKLSARSIKEPLKVCQKNQEIKESFRSDKLSLSKLLSEKQLPEYKKDGKVPAKTRPLDDVKVLKGLTKQYEPEDPGHCPIQVRIEKPIRADSGTELLKKSLPKIPNLKTPQLERTYKKSSPFRKLEKKIIEEPPKICVEKDQILCQTRRADENLVIKESHLPKFQPRSCNFTRDDRPEYAAPLKELSKKEVLEPERKCPPEPEKCRRADDQLRIIKKKLPNFKTKSNKCLRDVDTMKNSPPLTKLIPRRIVEHKTCIKKKENLEKCPTRSDIDDWKYIDEPTTNIATLNLGKHGNKLATYPKRSMSTNLFNNTKGILIRRTQTSHIDMRKRFSIDSFRRDEIRKVHSSTTVFCDESIKRELQPNYPLHSKFTKIEPVQPPAPKYDLEKEDECVREKDNITREDVTISCDNRNPKRTYLRASTKKCDQTNLSDPKCKKKNDLSAHGKKPPPSSSSSSFSSSSSSSSSYAGTLASNKSSCPPTFSCPPPCPRPCDQSGQKSKSKTSWLRRLIFYFKARPNCPTPEEYKKKKKLEKLKKMADRAGLGVYDPTSDPKLICQEVEQRCCLARKNFHGKKGQRSFHNYFAVRNYSVISPCCFLMPGNPWMFQRNFSSFQLMGPLRNKIDWRNPFEFYSRNNEENGIFDTDARLDLCPAKCDVDYFRECMFKTLVIPPSLSDEDDEKFRQNIYELIDYCPESLDVKQEILIEALKRLSQKLKIISKNNLDGFIAGSE